MSYHFTSGGCGIRPLIDLQIYDKNISYDKEKVLKMCEECGIKTFYEEILKLSNYWFNDGDKSGIIDNLQEFIASGGVYGITINRISVGTTKKGGKIKYLFSRIFIPYSILKIRYPKLKKHKYEVCRCCRIIFKGKFKKSISEIKFIKNNEKE